MPSFFAYNLPDMQITADCPGRAFGRIFQFRSTVDFRVFCGPNIDYAAVYYPVTPCGSLILRDIRTMKHVAWYNVQVNVPVLMDADPDKIREAEERAAAVFDIDTERRWKRIISSLETQQ